MEENITVGIHSCYKSLHSSHLFPFTFSLQHQWEETTKMVFKRFPTSSLSPYRNVYPYHFDNIYTCIEPTLLILFSLEIFSGLIGAFGRDDDDNHADDHHSTLW